MRRFHIMKRRSGSAWRHEVASRTSQSFSRGTQFESVSLKTAATRHKKVVSLKSTTSKRHSRKLPASRRLILTSELINLATLLFACFLSWRLTGSVTCWVSVRKFRETAQERGNHAQALAAAIKKAIDRAACTLVPATPQPPRTSTSLRKCSLQPPNLNLFSRLPENPCSPVSKRKAALHSSRRRSKCEVLRPACWRRSNAKRLRRNRSDRNASWDA